MSRFCVLYTHCTIWWSCGERFFDGKECLCFEFTHSGSLMSINKKSAFNGSLHTKLSLRLVLCISNQRFLCAHTPQRNLYLWTHIENYNRVLLDLTSSLMRRRLLILDGVSWQCALTQMRLHNNNRLLSLAQAHPHRQTKNKAATWSKSSNCIFRAKSRSEYSLAKIVHGNTEHLDSLQFKLFAQLLLPSRTSEEQKMILNSWRCLLCQALLICFCSLCKKLQVWLWLAIRVCVLCTAFVDSPLYLGSFYYI